MSAAREPALLAEMTTEVPTFCSSTVCQIYCTVVSFVKLFELAVNAMDLIENKHVCWCVKK